MAHKPIENLSSVLHRGYFRIRSRFIRPCLLARSLFLTLRPAQRCGVGGSRSQNQLKVRWVDLWISDILLYRVNVPQKCVVPAIALVVIPYTSTITEGHEEELRPRGRVQSVNYKFTRVTGDMSRSCEKAKNANLHNDLSICIPPNGDVWRGHCENLSSREQCSRLLLLSQRCSRASL